MSALVFASAREGIVPNSLVRCRKQFDADKPSVEAVLRQIDGSVFDEARPEGSGADIMGRLAPVVNYLGVMHDYLMALEKLTSSLEARRRAEADELRRMGETFGALFACADDGGYCWLPECADCALVGKQMNALGVRSARVAHVVEDW